MSTSLANESLTVWKLLEEVLYQKDDNELQKRQMRTLIEKHGPNAVEFLISALISRLLFSCSCQSSIDIKVSDVALLLDVICNCGAGDNDYSIRKGILGDMIIKYINRDDQQRKNKEVNCPVCKALFEDSSFVESEEVLNLLVLQVMRDDGGRLADKASKAICAYVRSVDDTKTTAMLNSAISATHEAWKGVVSSSSEEFSKSEKSTISIRYFCLLGHLAMLNNDAMKVVIDSNALDEILNETLLSTDASYDPLMQLSVIDFLENMCHQEPMHENRSKWLLSKSTVDFLLYLSGGNSKNESDPILGGPSLKLLSSFCRLIQHDNTLLAVEGGKDIMRGFRSALIKTNLCGELDRLAFIDAVSSFCASSSDALSLIIHDYEIRDAWLNIGNAQAKMKAAILHSVAQVIDPIMGSQCEKNKMVYVSNASAFELVEAFGDVNACPTAELLMTLIQKPIIEPRLGAYDLMRSICTRGVGSQLMLSQAGLFEYLINRETESTKEGREAKYEVVAAIMKSEAKSLLADNIVKAFSEIISQGPHYMKARTWDMMTE